MDCKWKTTNKQNHKKNRHTNTSQIFGTHPFAVPFELWIDFAFIATHLCSGMLCASGDATVPKCIFRFIFVFFFVFHSILPITAANKCFISIRWVRGKTKKMKMKTSPFTVFSSLDSVRNTSNTNICRMNEQTEKTSTHTQLKTGDMFFFGLLVWQHNTSSNDDGMRGKRNNVCATHNIRLYRCTHSVHMENAVIVAHFSTT